MKKTSIKNYLKTLSHFLYSYKGKYPTSNFIKIKYVFVILSVFILSFMQSCKTCKCPAYSQASTFKATEIMDNPNFT